MDGAAPRGASAEERDKLVEAGYPRPQLVRPGWTDLSGPWELAFDDAGEGGQQGWTDGRSGPFDHRIVVPYPPESPLSGIGDRGFHPIVWYRRHIALPRRAPDERLILHFGAVDYAAGVWVNGEWAGGHEGGHTPFSFDITRAAGTGPSAVIVVRAFDDPADPHQPRGKQDWRLDPHAIWYHRTTGIWQPVWLEVVPRCHLTALAWECDLAAGRVGADVRLSRPLPPLSTVSIRLRLGPELIAEQSAVISGAFHHMDLSIPAAGNAWDRERLCWSTDRPTLIDADVELAGPGRDTIDRAGSYLGLRELGVADGRFLLNGAPQFLRFALEQGYWPGSHLAAPSPRALRDEVEAARALGFNGVRLHQKAEDPRFLYWADRIGLMVWVEMPSTGAFSPRATRRLLAEWQEIVDRDRSHPSVVAWVPFNESWGVPDLARRPDQRDLVAALYHLTRSLDPSRPVISNDGWEHVDSDIWTVHDYALSGSGLTARYRDGQETARTLGPRWPGGHRVVLGGAAQRGQPVMVTEFGGLTYAPGAEGTWLGYGSAASPAELEERLAELVDALCSSDSIAGFCYTQLTDTEQERNGLLYPDRTAKVPADRIAAIIRRPARAVPTEERTAARRQPVPAGDDPAGAGPAGTGPAGTGPAGAGPAGASLDATGRATSPS